MLAILGSRRHLAAFPALDEDVLTMMIDAARPLLAAQTGEIPSCLALASLSFPYRRRVQAGLVAMALGLPSTTFCLEATTSERAATEGLRALGGMLHVAPSETGLLLAADGGYAVSLLLGTASAGPVVGTLLAAQSALAEYPGLQFTLAGEAALRDVSVPDYTEAAYLDLVRQAVDGLQGDILALNPPQERLGALAARALGYGRAISPPQQSGAAGPLLALLTALDVATPGQRVLWISYGAGSAADALLVQKGR